MQAEPRPILDEDLKRTLRFLVLEVIKQIGSAARALEGHEDIELDAMSSRDDYIDHLRIQAENKCYTLLRRTRRIEKATVDYLRSTTAIASNLERIADHAVSIVRQAQRLRPAGYLHAYEFQPFFDVIYHSLQEVSSAWEELDSAAAVVIADGELELDDLYKDRFSRILEDLKSRGEVPMLVTSLLIFHYLERIGDCLQNIGEAVISAEVGERMKMRTYRELAGSLERRAGEAAMDEVEFEGVWGTRSGAQIGKVRAAQLESAGGTAIFKRGHPSKMQAEREAMERWGSLAPGIAPRVLKYTEAERDSMLVEYLQGQTLLEIVTTAPMPVIEQVLGRVQQTLEKVWLDTKVDEEVRPRFLAQLQRRLPDVYSVHPDFQQESQEISGHHVATLQELIDASIGLDDELRAPFSVIGHGDFNLDNIIYNASADTVHFIDLHRSNRMDYAQDVSVFLVSNFRVPEFRPRRRAQLNRVIELQLEFARGFAARHDDPTFEARLALGLVRSFVSSTRFDIRREFAKEMLRRGSYLLERLRRFDGTDLATFRLPHDVLIYTT